MGRNQRPISSSDDVSGVESSADSSAGSEAHNNSPEPICTVASKDVAKGDVVSEQDVVREEGDG